MFAMFYIPTREFSERPPLFFEFSFC